MGDKKEVDKGRRVLLMATCAVGGVAGLATTGMFVSTLQPSERAKAAGGSVEADISDLPPGQMKIVEWRGLPIWIIRRTPEMLGLLVKNDPSLADPKSEIDPQTWTPEYARNEHRSIKPEILVAIGICTHLGCSPTAKFQTGPQPSLPDDWTGGFLCPCHGSTFDLAGRVYKNKPAPYNLQIPRHMYVNDTQIIIGKDHEGEA